MISVVFIVPAAIVGAANALADAFGHGPNSYTVPLSADGNAPATHYGAHSWTHDDFPAILDAAQAQTLSPLPEGVDGAALAAVVAQVIRSVSASDADSYNHFNVVVAANGLQKITPE